MGIIDILVRLAEADRNDPEKILNYRYSPSGRAIALSAASVLCRAQQH